MKSFWFPSILFSSKRGIDFGLGRGFSGSQAAKHFMGMAAARYSGGPGRKKKRSQYWTEKSLFMYPLRLQEIINYKKHSSKVHSLNCLAIFLHDHPSFQHLHSKCPEMILNKIEKTFNKSLKGLKNFFSEIPNLFFSKS